MKAVVLLWRNWIKFIDPVRCFEKNNRKIRTLQAIHSDGDGKIDGPKKAPKYDPKCFLFTSSNITQFFLFLASKATLFNVHTVFSET